MYKRCIYGVPHVGLFHRSLPDFDNSGCKPQKNEPWIYNAGFCK